MNNRFNLNESEKNRIRLLHGINLINEEDEKSLKKERDWRIGELKIERELKLKSDKLIGSLNKELEKLRKEYSDVNVTTMSEKPPMYGGSISTKEDVGEMKENIKEVKKKIKVQIRNIKDSYKDSIDKVKEEYKEKIKNL